jgi:phosphoadenosine phosphosulfate reductase
VVLVDTGYLFPETYRFIDALSERLSLNLHVYRAQHSPAGRKPVTASSGSRVWKGSNATTGSTRSSRCSGRSRNLGAAAWISGLRRQQAKSRQHLDVLLWRNGRCKIHPLIDWTDRDVYRYLTKYGLPYHPLWEQGYVSIGDVHTTHRWSTA